jgi:O-acetylserine/cysteine efflux transporter
MIARQSRVRGLGLPAVLALVGICFVWAVNAVLLRFAVGPSQLPPVWLAAGRFLVAGLCFSPLLRHRPDRFAMVLLAGFLMGAGHFSLLMLGYVRLDSSTAALILQLGTPATALISMIAGAERWSLPRLALILAATLAVLLAIGTGQGGTDPSGVLLIVGSSLSLSFGSVLIKGTGRASALQMQAWTSAISAVVLLLLAPIQEPEGLTALVAQPLLSAIAILCPAVVVTLVAHTVYYALLKANDPSSVAAMTLLFPLFTVLLGVSVLGEVVGISFWLGGGVALFCVLLLVWR